MTGPRAYLDWNASAPLLPAAREAMLRALDVVGNPSSVHGEGRAARRIVEDAREAVAALVEAKPSEVFFTSGATEANNLVLANPFDQIVVAGTEHASVLEPARAAAVERVEIAARPDGTVALDQLAQIRWRPAPLVCVGLANSETGVVQPFRAITERVPAGGRVHADATQAVGRIPVSFRSLGATFLSLSAHKIGGPKGAGALLVREGSGLVARFTGGGQERGMRAGTENVAAIAGFGAAACAARVRLAAWQATSARRDAMERALLQLRPSLRVIGAEAERLPNTSCVALPGRSAETLVAALDLAGVAVSAGSACSSGKVGASHVLAAMGLGRDLARSAIRISIGPETTDAEIALLLGAVESVTRSVAAAA